MALVIGNSAYETVPALPNPGNDSGAMAAKLEELGFEVLLRTDLDQTEMATTLGEFTAALEGADVGLFFYAGHGIQFDGRNYLISTNAELANQFALQSEAFPLDQIVDVMRESTAINIVLLDACRDNPFVDRLKEALPATRSASVTRGLARLSSPAGDTMIVYATAADQTAADGAGNHSPFTQALLDNLGTPGVEVSLLLKRVIQDVREKTLYTQNPEVLSAMAREFYFAGPTTPIESPAIAPVEVAAAAEPQSQIVENAVAAPVRTPAPLPAEPEAGGFDTSLLAALDVEAALEAGQKEATLAPTPEAIELALGLGQEDVMRIQTALNAMGYNLGLADGAFGNKSRAALKAFQVVHRVPQTGYLDADTIGAILRAFDEAPKTYAGKWQINIYRRWRVTDRSEPNNTPGTKELLAVVRLSTVDGELFIDDYQILTVMPEEPFKDFVAVIDGSGRLKVTGMVSTHFLDANNPVANLAGLVVDLQLPRIMPFNRTIEATANDFERDLGFAISIQRRRS